ncbi:MAG: NAD(P)/FAD-dependent oxidoreductase [Candidatus Acidiferrales bacterium]
MGFNYDVLIIGAGPAGSTAAKRLADARYRTLLVDKARFPRHKTCASWINRLAFERFPYLEAHRDELVDSPFHGVSFFDDDLGRRADWTERRPSGYLSLRSKFDNALKDIAVRAGAEFREGSGLAALEVAGGRVTIRLDTGEEVTSRALIGADGAHSRVAHLAGLRTGWSKNEYVLCANEDLPYPAGEIARHYSARPPLLVALRFDGLTGYGWIFPKRKHICIGIGGRLREGERIQDLYTKFFRAAQARGLLPAGAAPKDVYYDLDPAGAVNKGGPLVRGPVVLVGDAGGFVSGSTGEGIYPGMESARLAAELVERGLRAGKLEDELKRFETLWRERLGGFIRDLPGGEQRQPRTQTPSPVGASNSVPEGVWVRGQQTVDRIGLIFRSRLVCGVAARVFLYGEPASLGTLVRALRS